MLTQLLRFLMGHWPVVCSMCHNWIWHKDACFARALTGENITLCGECQQRLFNPYSTMSKN